MHFRLQLEMQQQFHSLLKISDIQLSSHMGRTETKIRLRTGQCIGPL